VIRIVLLCLCPFCIVALSASVFALSACSGQTERFERQKMLQEEILIRQQQELERQERDYEDIQRQEYHNRTLEPYLRRN